MSKVLVWASVITSLYILKCTENTEIFVQTFWYVIVDINKEIGATWRLLNFLIDNYY